MFKSQDLAKTDLFAHLTYIGWDKNKQPFFECNLFDLNQGLILEIDAF